MVTNETRTPHVNDPAVIRRRLTDPGTWAVVGLSRNTARPAHGVARWLKHERGATIVPIHPAAEAVDGDPAYASLSDIPEGTRIDVVDCFVASERVGAVVDEVIAVDDAGTILNPLLAEGQIHGGLVQGISQALWEEAVYDDAGTLVSGSFVDYLVPTAADTISFDTATTTTAATGNTLGTKGVGEAGTIASTPCIVNGVVDALRIFGVDDVQMPCTPERVWKAIRQAGTSEGSGQ